MAKNEKPGHRTSADFAGSDHLDRHPRKYTDNLEKLETGISAGVKSWPWM